jgi:hypothetical protein
MVFELIAIFVLALSAGTMVTILVKKMPELKKLPESSFGLRVAFASGAKNVISKIPGLNNFSYDLYLQKMLSKFRVLSMKTESKTGNWLEKLRQKKTQKDIETTENNGYWDELKKAKDDR